MYLSVLYFISVPPPKLNTGLDSRLVAMSEYSLLQKFFGKMFVTLTREHHNLSDGERVLCKKVSPSYGSSM